MVNMGLLAPGATPLSTSSGKGINETWRGRVHLLDSTTVVAYVKLIDSKQLTNELLGAELARAVGFKVPDTYLVRVDKTHYAALFAQLGITADYVVAFGCRDVGAKSLARQYRDGGMPFIHWFVQTCTHWKRVVSFDGWIGNIDRHLGNALIGASDDLWLIDHGHCFTGPAWTDAQLVPTATFINRLVNELNPVLTDDIRDAVALDAQNAQTIFDLVHVEGVLQDSQAEGFISTIERQALLEFIEKRKLRVLEFVNVALGRPMLPLEGAML